MATKREHNARYYAAHSDRLILRESELRASTVLELLDCLRDLDLHPADKRIGRLEELYRDLTGEDLPNRHPEADGESSESAAID
jgi:hypothetical protein